MKKTVIAICILLVCHSILLAALCISSRPNGDTVVWTASHGSCYHKSGCSTLHYTKSETTLSEAVDHGYKRCSVCNPPKLRSVSAHKELNLGLFSEFLFGAIPISIFIWCFSMPLFYLLGIEGDQLPLLVHYLFAFFSLCVSYVLA